MTAIPFCKFEGFGNDYIVIERSEIPENTSASDLTRSICDRHKGVGSDGVAILEKLDFEEPADYSCEIINPDGSVAGFSGNGTRCAVAYLHFKKLWTQQGLKLRTRSGIKNYTLLETVSDGHYWFEAEIGKPKFHSDEIPIATEFPMETVIDRAIPVGRAWVSINAVNVGNPVAAVFVDGFETDWRGLGKELESHGAFPERTNVVFIKVLDVENIEVRIWERGAGETSASGTCASGAAILSAFTGRTERTVSVQSPGGVTEVYWRDDDEILLTGRADLAYCGEWPV